MALQTDTSTKLSTGMEKLSFLLEAEAELSLCGDPSTSLRPGEELSARAAEEQRRYVTNFIGSKQKLIDFIWANTPGGISSAADMFSGSSVVGFMFKQRAWR